MHRAGRGEKKKGRKGEGTEQGGRKAGGKGVGGVKHPRQGLAKPPSLLCVVVNCNTLCKSQSTSVVIDPVIRLKTSMPRQHKLQVRSVIWLSSLTQACQTDHLKTIRSACMTIVVSRTTMRS